MTENRFSIETALYTLALLLALGVRLFNLGATPLSDFESSYALRALDAVNKYELTGIEGAAEDFNPQPSYTSLTGLTAFLFDSTNFLARFWPALVGASLVLVPYFFRPLLGRKAALILAFGLALDPGMVAISRLAGGQMLALGFGLWSLEFAYARKSVWSGFFAGLALLSGPTALQGLLGLALTWVTAKVIGNFGVLSQNQEEGDGFVVGLPSKGAFLTWILTAGATILLVGSIFLIYPQGLSNWVITFPALIKGWVGSDGVPALRLLAALVIYQPLALIFGLIGGVRGWVHGKRLEQLLSLWLLFALVLALLYPSRQVGDLVWVLIPLWSLAGLELARSLVWDSKFGIISLGQAVLIFLIMALFWINLSGVSVIISDLQSTAVRLGVLGGVLALAAVVTALVTFGWSWEIARRGLIWGFSLALGVYGFANMWSASQLLQRGNIGLWHPFPITADADLMIKTVEDLSKWNTGRTDAIDITVAIEAPSLHWALRNFSQVNFIPERELLTIRGESSVVVALQIQESPSLADSYRGQDFAWWSYPDWTGALPSDSFKWLVFRSAPIKQEQLILWARDDLFPDGFDLPQSETPLLPEEGLPAGDIEQE